MISDSETGLSNEFTNIFMFAQSLETTTLIIGGEFQKCQWININLKLS